MTNDAKKPTGIINIHGREYETVALRVKRFREAHPDWAIVTEILHRDAEVVIIKATICAPNHSMSGTVDRVVATGHAEEWRKASTINKTSAIENAETSAIGRALAALGMGGTEFASANEIEIAKNKQAAGADDVLDRLKGDKPNTASAVAGDAFADLPADAQQVVREWALEIIADVEAGNAGRANAFADANCKTQEDKLALWSQLPSKVRSAMKAARNGALATQG